MKEFNRDNLKDWELKIVEKYPLIYLEGAKENETNLRFGFEFNEGWSNLVNEFSKIASDLVLQLRESGIQKDAFIHSCIFKEKFGVLCWQGDDNLIEPFKTLFKSYISIIENRSKYICEISGDIGERRSRGGWIKTLSKEKAIELGYN